MPLGVLTEVCVCVSVSCLPLCVCVCVCPLMMGTEEWGQMTRFEREVLCSQSIIFREESRRIKVASCHFRDVRQIPADRVNIAVRVCVPSPLCPPYPSLRQPVPLCCYFNLPVFSFFLNFPPCLSTRKTSPDARELFKKSDVGISQCVNYTR